MTFVDWFSSIPVLLSHCPLFEQLLGHGVMMFGNSDSFSSRCLLDSVLDGGDVFRRDKNEVSVVI